MGARGAGMAFTSATLRDEWSLFNNVGGLAPNKNASAAFAYEARPGIPGANLTAAVFNSPFKIGTASLGLFRFGDDLYSEQIISAGYGNQFGITSLGLKINYIQYHADGFGIRHAVSLNFGGISQLTPHLAVGACIVNLNQPRISSFDQERLPTKLVAGISYTTSEQMMIAAELEKDLDYEVTVKGGMEYAVHKKFLFRTGFNLHPQSAFFGLGYIFHRLKIDYAFQYNSSLGGAHQASAIYRVEKVKPKRGQ
jgi:hypothetical protein